MQTTRSCHVRRRRARLVSVLAALGTALAACGGGTATTSSTTTISTTSSTVAPASSTTVAVTTTAADAVVAALTAALVRPSDLSAGWTVSPHEGSDTANACTANVATPRAKAYGDDFSHGDFTLSSSAALFADESQARLFFANLRNPAVRECMRKLMTEGFTSPITGTSITVAIADLPTVAYGDESLALRITVTITPRSGTAETGILDVLFVRLGRGGVILQFIGPVPALETTAANPLAVVVVERVRRVVASAT